MSERKHVHIQSVDSIGHLVDRLVVENIKLAEFTRRIEVEQRKDDCDTNLVNRLYTGLRLANEARAYIKNSIDECISRAINAGEYHILREVRTHRLPTHEEADENLQLPTVVGQDVHERAAELLENDKG